MNNHSCTKIFIGFLIVAILFNFLGTPQSVAAASEAIYDAIPDQLPGNIASLGFEATSTAEVGDYIHLAGTHRDVTEVTVTMSTWALHSTYPGMSSEGWTHPITLNIYNVISGVPNLRGSLIASRTQTFDIPWRPEADPTCPGGTAWRATNGTCYNGLAFNITFDLSSLSVTLPDDVILAVAYNTQHYGITPIAQSGPYNSLNVGLVGTLTAGTDDNTDKLFLNSSWSGAYTTGWNGGTGGLREDSDWSPYATLPFQILWKDGIFPTTTGSVPLDGATITNGPTQLSVNFSEDVLHDGSIDAANFTGNYLLFEDGMNAGFDTEDCGGVEGDDTEIEINDVQYNSANFTATLNINTGLPLPVGRYRLLACGTSSILDLDGYELNSGLIDSAFTFSVTAPVHPGVDNSTIPSTGFAPDKFTTLPAQNVRYTPHADLWLEVPSLGIQADIVGVPSLNGAWDVTWLGNDAGWLEGSAFPTWEGNSVLTGHVWNANNTPGLFFGIDTLSFGDRVIVHFNGLDYTYSVRSVRLVTDAEVSAALKHEDRSWVTLVTCKGFDESTGKYLYRILVRAVLVDVK